MRDRAAILGTYEALLRVFFRGSDEAAYFSVAELGKELVLAKAGPDVLVDIHAAALKNVIHDADPLTVTRLVVNANELLLNGIMAYAMTYYGFLDQIEAEGRKLAAAQEQAARERDNLDAIVSAIDADLLLLDPDLTIRWVNRRLRERSRFDSGELLGKPCNLAYCNAPTAPEDCPALVAFRTGRPVRQEHPINHPDGAARHYQFTCSPLPGKDGSPSQVLELVQDVTDRRDLAHELGEKAAALEVANEKLRSLDRLKAMFIAAMSHELRTPLNAIIGFSSILKDEWLGPLNPEQKENQEAILRAGRHLLALINDVIDISKIEAGVLETARDRFDLGGAVAEAVDLVRGAAEDKGLELRVEAAPVEMHADRRRLVQCLVNLLGNAVKFTDEGRVAVTARTLAAADGGGAWAEIAVADTGIGIREEDLPKVFGAFSRLVPAGDARRPGTGLGLYLTQKLVTETLGGELTVTSVYGQGSTFTIRLPLAAGG